MEEGVGAAVAMLDVSMSYGSDQILFDLDLEVRRGEILGLLGTNGAGKSTVLRVLTGLARPSKGAVHFFGEDITDVPP